MAWEKYGKNKHLLLQNCLALYCIAIQLMICIIPSIEVDWKQAEGILFTLNQKYFAVCCGFQVSDSFQLLFSYWELSSIWWTCIMSGLFLLWHMVCNIFFWAGFLFVSICFGNIFVPWYLSFPIKFKGNASGMSDGGTYGSLYFSWMLFDWLKKCYVLVHNVILKTTSRAMMKLFTEKVTFWIEEK